MRGVISAWGRILTGYNPCLSIEVTRECPLRCPGCYAYTPDHLGGGVVLRELQDNQGDDLVQGVLGLIRKHKPLHVSLIGGEPLVRYKELSRLLPEMSKMGVHTQVVTSAVREIPLEWAQIPRVQISVSIDGLQPEHDRRRTPATYDRILKNIQGHFITVHCTLTRQQLQRQGYIEEFVAYWSALETTKRIWISLYTPQIGEVSPERLTGEDRIAAVAELKRLNKKYPKLEVPDALLEVYAEPPESPDECIFANTTTCLSADFQKQITPCQFGGKPDCSNCGCMASAGMAAVGRHRLPGGIKVGSLFTISSRIGDFARRMRNGDGS